MKNFKATKLALLTAILTGGVMGANVHAADGADSQTRVPTAYGERDTVPNDEFLSEEADTFRARGSDADSSALSSSQSESEREFSATESSAEPSDSDLYGSAAGSSTMAQQASNQINFEFDSDQLSEEARSTLDQLAEGLKDEQRPVSVSISGYTDATGPAEYNKDLAERRAKAVQDYLKDKDIEVSNWDLNAPGEESPVASNESREGRQENRRVEIDFSGAEQADQEVSVVTD